ncbi:2Fe-2S iron-sulfur cluster-binding protein [Crocinitomix algicola]|uniref:2Fe-2S iron-sulfur cluster-binding protein n=1 Tax=Crocinitomix algicola TaxID=1740263 RepID=UPI0008342718|nr:2Fe-2S iron-sulfur cluster-binding protein [Crocinitomix algicola]
MSTSFYNLKVANINKETADTVSITFDVPGTLAGEFKFEPGQYLTLKTLINGEDVRRSYSICSAPHEHQLTVAVKEIENGLFSSFANNTLKSGDELEVMPPMGNFKVNPKQGNSAHYVFYAAGSGITPVLSMIKAILNEESESTIQLYYGNKNTESVIFKDELDALSSANDGFKLTYIYSQENSGDALTTGRIDRAKCAEFFSKDQAGKAIAGIYACGPEEMIMTIKDFYLAEGIDSKKIHFELFTVSVPTENVSVESGAPIESQVTVIIDDEEYEFELNSNGTNILQAAQDEDADVPFSCKGGVCCTCRAKVLEGTVRMDLNFALEEDEVENGFILTCQAHPTSEKVVVSFDEY